MDKTRPVSAKEASSATPRILCSRIEETSVGEALASLAYVLARALTIAVAGTTVRVYKLLNENFVSPRPALSMWSISL